MTIKHDPLQLLIYNCEFLSDRSKVKGTNSATSMGAVPQPEGFLSKRKRHVSKDRDLLSRLESLVVAGKLDGESMICLYGDLYSQVLTRPLDIG